jgi:dTDP-4-amino-4,6-dideoxygalactose transaminase/glycosyltransferase involved in cell wall biosynthesis
MTRSFLARLRDDPGAAQRPTGTGMPPSRRIEPTLHEHEYAQAVRMLRDGPADLLPPVDGQSEKTCLRIAVVVPPFHFGSGGHDVLFQLISRWERAGHTCSLWIHDPFREAAGDAESVIRRTIVESFGASIEAPVHKGFDQWRGADVAIATGWQTVYPVLELGGCRARAYLVNDYEPAFYGTSIETWLSGMTYRQPLRAIVGSPWLLDTLRSRFGMDGGTFRYAIDDAYEPRDVERRDDTIVLYARSVTPRRAVALGVLALEELWRRRPGRVRIVMFGDEHPMPSSFPYDFLGKVTPDQLSWVYSEAAVGLAFSMTNTSLVPQDMIACGLPALELAGFGGESVYGARGPIELVPYEPVEIADRIERLLDDPGERERRRVAGLELARRLSWDNAALEVERELRTALREREELGLPLSVTIGTDRPPRAEPLVFGAPVIEDGEIDEVEATLRSGWIGTGPRVARFEEEFRTYLGGGQVVAVSSGTAAMHLALLTLGVGPGDEVITTPMTFAATANVIVHTGATPVFADCDPDTLCIDPAAVEAAITPRTKAIMPVHLAGRPCDMDALEAIAETHGLKLVGDCAHAVETRWRGTAAGLLGDASAFSFYATKNVTTAEGGMLVLRDPELAERAKTLSLHGLSSDAWRRHADIGYRHYAVVEAGYKYNLTDLQAAIGLHQLARVDRGHARRAQIWARYQEAFADLPLRLPAEPAPGTVHAHHLYSPRVTDDSPLGRDATIAALGERNIGTGVHYTALHTHPYYERLLGLAPEALPNAADAGRTTFSVPLSPKLSDGDVDDVITAVRFAQGATPISR